MFEHFRTAVRTELESKWIQYFNGDLELKAFVRKYYQNHARADYNSEFGLVHYMKQAEEVFDEFVKS